jgi:hypothetical protein
VSGKRVTTDGFKSPSVRGCCRHTTLSTQPMNGGRNGEGSRGGLGLARRRWQLSCVGTGRLDMWSGPFPLSGRRCSRELNASAGLVNGWACLRDHIQGRLGEVEPVRAQLVNTRTAREPRGARVCVHTGLGQIGEESPHERGLVGSGGGR